MITIAHSDWCGCYRLDHGTAISDNKEEGGIAESYDDAPATTRSRVLSASKVCARADRTDITRALRSNINSSQLEAALFARYNVSYSETFP